MRQGFTVLRFSGCNHTQGKEKCNLKGGQHNVLKERICFRILKRMSVVEYCANKYACDVRLKESVGMSDI